MPDNYSNTTLPPRSREFNIRSSHIAWRHFWTITLSELWQQYWQSLISSTMFEKSRDSKPSRRDDSNDVHLKSQKWRKLRFQEAPRCRFHGAFGRSGSWVLASRHGSSVGQRVSSGPINEINSDTSLAMSSRSRANCYRPPTQKRVEGCFETLHVLRWDQRVEEVKTLLIPQLRKWAETLR